MKEKKFYPFEGLFIGMVIGILVGIILNNIYIALGLGSLIGVMMEYSMTLKEKVINEKDRI